MKHIDELTIHRYRGIRDLKLNGLGQINLLVGDNNSGKTSILEALALFSDPMSVRIWIDVASLREISFDSHPVLIDQIVWLFPQGKDSNGSSPSTIHISGSGEYPPDEVSASYSRFTEVDTRTPRLKEYEGVRIQASALANSQEVGKTTHNIYENWTTISDGDFSPDVNSSFSRGFEPLPVEIITIASHYLSNLSPQLWSEVVEADLKAETIDLLRLFDPDIQDVDIVTLQDRQPTLSVKHGQLRRAPLSTFGDGLRRVFTLITAVPKVKGGLLFIDDLETAIHTSALDKTYKRLIQACVQNDVQLFATTHSLEAVDAALNAVAEDVDLVVYRLRKKEAGINLTRFHRHALTGMRNEMGLEVR